MASPAISGDNGDPDADTIPNCLEYACGLNPKASEFPDKGNAIVFGVVTIGPNTLADILFKRRSYEPSLTYRVELTDDLQNWQFGPAIFSTLGVASLNYEFENVHVQELPGFSLATRRYARLVVVKNDTDSDGDELPDVYEQAIVDADPGDGITTILGVLPGDDFDGDGRTNEEEYLDGTDPTDPGDSLVQEPARSPSFGMDASDNPEGTVLLHSGEFRLERTDMVIPARSLGFRFTRVYRSRAQAQGPLGHGWDANVFTRLETQLNGDVICFPGNGRADRYVSLGGGNYTSPAGFYTKLRDVPGGHELRDSRGTINSYDSLGRVTGIETRTGDTQQYVYTGDKLTSVFDDFGREITFQYDAFDRLQSVTDFTNRSVVFGYDSNNNLTEARSPLVTGTPHGNDFPAGKRERYSYDTGSSDILLAHNLLEVVAPNEVENGSLTPCVINTYGTSGQTFDRLTDQTVGGTNASGRPAGGPLNYVYDFSPSAGPAGTTRSTRVQDRESNLADYFHGGPGHCLQYIEDPLGPTPFITTCEYNIHGERTKLTLPETNRFDWVYDDANPDRFQAGNLLSEIRIPDVARGGAQAQLTTTYTYEPIYNLRRTITTPRGNDATYVPQNGGAQSAARYTTTHTYDYMEAVSPPAVATTWGITVPGLLLNFGDVNNDGITNQAAGNRIFCAYPTVSLVQSPNQQAAEGDPNQEVFTIRRYNGFGQITELEDARGNIDTFIYYPENDPDGDLLDLIGGADPTTGGHLELFNTDAFAGPNRQDPLPPENIQEKMIRSRRGHVIVFQDGRGSEHITTRNQLDQIILTEAPKVDASQPDGYQKKFFYDANDNIVHVQVENETTDPSTHLPIVVVGDPAFDHFQVYDILDNLIEKTEDAKRDAAIPASAQSEVLVTRFFYDANENKTRTESPLAVDGTDPFNELLRVYDERDLVFSETLGNGSPGASTRTYAYDQNGNVTESVDAEDTDGVGGPETDTRLYDGFDRLTDRIDRVGNTTTYGYDPADNVVSEEIFGPADGNSAVNVLLRDRDYLFDEINRLIRTDDDLFVATGLTLVVTPPPTDGPLTPGDGLFSELFEYDANSRPTFRTEDDGFVYGTTYDGADRAVRVTTPQVDTVTGGGPFATESVTTYDGNDNRVMIVETHSNPNGIQPPLILETINVFDALDRLMRTTDTEGNTLRFEYDSRDNVVSRYDGRGPAIADPLGLYVAGTINDFGNATRSRHDGINRCWVEEKELTTSGIGGDPLDLTNPSNTDGLITIRRIYDANSRLVDMIDDRGFATTYTYDSINRRIRQDNADGGFRVMTYDLDHNVTQLVDENNTAHTMTYDGLDRRLSHAVVPDPARTVGGGAFPLIVGTTLREWEYDGRSRPTECRDNNDPGAADDSIVVTRYDSLSRRVEEDQDGVTIGCKFESDDRTGLIYPGGGRNLNFAFDALDQLTQIAEPATLFFAEEHLGWRHHPILTVQGTNPGAPALETGTNLDPNKDPVGALTFNPGLVFDVQGVNAVRNGNRDQENFEVTRLPGNPASHRQDVYMVDQDSDDRTRGQVRDIFNFGGPAGQTTRNVELSGKEETVVVAGVGVVPQNNTFNQVGERTNPPFQFDGDGGLTGTGIRTQDQNFIIQWDGCNRPQVIRDAVTPANIISEFDYDSSPAVTGGRRIRKDVQNSGALNGVTRFYFDGLHCIEERDDTTNFITRQFIFGGFTDDVLAMDRDTNADGVPDQLFFYVKDFNGNTTQLTDVNGQPVEFYGYDTYAGPEFYNPAAPFAPQPGGQFGNPYLFTGRRFDEETGFYYFNSRNYDPVANEFLSRDPFGIWGTSCNDGNPMAYAGNNVWNANSATATCTSGKGPQPITARSSVDLGNNSNWDFQGGGSLLVNGASALGNTDGAINRVRLMYNFQLDFTSIGSVHEQFELSLFDGSGTSAGPAAGTTSNAAAAGDALWDRKKRYFVPIGRDYSECRIFRWLGLLDGGGTGDVIPGGGASVGDSTKGTDPDFYVESPIDDDDALELRKRPGRTKFGDITLKKGYITNKELQQWWQSSKDANLRRPVFMVDPGPPYQPPKWKFEDAWPSKWKLPEMDGKASDVMTEEIVIAIEGIKFG